MDSSQNDSTESPPNKRRKVDNIADTPNVDIDEGFYRQTDVLGRTAMIKLLQSNVLLSGLGGLGVEVAKNIILSGAKSVTLHDSRSCTVTDLSSQYYLTRDDVGRNRAEASCGRLSNLNPRVSTSFFIGDLTEDFVKRFTAVVLTDSDLHEHLRIDSITRANNIPLIIASTKGLCGQVFCDFGENFEVTDVNGEVCSLAYVANITNDITGVVTCFRTKRHDLADGDLVTFRKVVGMTELNGCEPKKVTVINSFEFSIGDTSMYSKYLCGGIVEQTKIPQVFIFKSLACALDDPMFVVTDSKKPDHPEQLHLAFRTLHQFKDTYKRDPRQWNSEDSEEFANLAFSAWECNKNGNAPNRELIELFSKTCTGNLCPVNSIIGGVVAQEVIKACCGKLSPLYQWLYFDAFECLKYGFPIVQDCRPIDNRYDGQASVFGRYLQIKLGNLKMLIVGAGSVGCEVLKNLAMMGVGEINRGRITVAESDLIRKSHLNSQFLYRSEELLSSKCKTAVNSIRQINLNTNMIPSEVKLCHDTENIYDDDFFENIDIVIVNGDLGSRKYVDRKCVYHRKPVIQSGVFGTKGSTQVIFPLQTQSYLCSRDISDINIEKRSQEIPCTTEDALCWARTNFDSLFHKSVHNVQMYLDGRLIRETDFSNEQSLEVLEGVKRMLVDDKPRCFQDCLIWARKIWENEYVERIRKILTKYPPDKTFSFWLPPRKCPTPLCFSVQSSLHLDYITIAANLRAEIFGIPKNYDKDSILHSVTNLAVDTTSSIEHTTLENNRSRTSYRNRLHQVLLELPSIEQLNDLKVTVVDFDPDNDAHVGFVVAAANLLAANFSIEPADCHKAKLVVGNFTPSIITTSSVVAGLVGLELIKLTQRLDTTNVSILKNGFINLALPFFDFAEPLAPTGYTYNDTRWTVWDRFEINGELSMEEFLRYFRTKDLTITMIHHGSCVLYSEFFSLSRLQEIRKLTMSQVLRKMSGKELRHNVRTLMFNLVCTDRDNNDVEVPHVRYVLPPLPVEQS